MIDADRLAVLRAVAHRKTLAAAATDLHRTPSAISQQIRQLSRETGVELLKPQGRGVILTEAAKRLIRYADEVALAWEQTSTDLAKYASNEIGQIRICGFATSIAALVAPAARRLCETYPDITVHIHEADVGESFDSLATERADLIVLPAGEAPRIDEIRYQSIHLFSDRQDIIVARDHSHAARRIIPIEEMRSETWIEPHHDQKDLIKVACQSAGFSPRFRHQADDWNAVIALISEGFGICLVPKLIPIPQGKTVSRLQVSGPGATARHTLVCIRRGSQERPRIQRMLQMLEQTAQAYEDDHLRSL